MCRIVFNLKNLSVFGKINSSSDFFFKCRMGIYLSCVLYNQLLQEIDIPKSLVFFGLPSNSDFLDFSTNFYVCVSVFFGDFYHLKFEMVFTIALCMEV